MTEPLLPDYSAGHYDGTIPASRWLTRLNYDFKKAGHKKPDPEMFLEAIEMLMEGEPAKRLDSTPRIRKLIDRRSTDSPQIDVDTVKEWLMEEFPSSVQDVTETDVQTEIEGLLQMADEPLAAYYQRAASILRRTHGRDKPREDGGGAPLSGLESTMLNTVVNAFVKGLYQDELRRSAFHKDAATCGALWKSYEMVLHAQRSLALEKQMEETIAKSRRLE
jgi:hypothetical protein